MSIASIIKSVAPAGAATKWTEARLNCSPRQAKRIVSEGRVANRFRDTIIAMLERELERRRQQLDEIDSQLQEIRYQRICTTAEARRRGGMDAAADVGDRQAQGPASALPLGDAR